MISCPTCSTRQEVGEEVKDHPLKQGHSEGYRRVNCMYRGYREGEFLLATANEIIRDRIIMRHRSELFYRIGIIPMN